LVSKAIRSGLGLQCRRKHRVDASLHGLLGLPISKPSGLWPNVLESSLLRSHLATELGLLLLLLDAKL
jgi:hypothetical protein